VRDDWMDGWLVGGEKVSGSARGAESWFWCVLGGEMCSYADNGGFCCWSRIKVPIGLGLGELDFG
jgi:hypothetical protein